MSAFAAVMTGPGAGAIATIQLFGRSVEAVVANVFRSSAEKPQAFETGLVLLGRIVDGAHTVDQVTVGCEGPQTFAIHCHGNPLIVERIMKLLQRRGVELLDAQTLLTAMLSGRQAGDAIAVEAKLALAKVKTVEGARIIAGQIEGGLGRRVRQWSRELDSMPIDEIARQAKQALRDSGIARLIAFGCVIALIGPPNSGKSTLLNALAGCEKAIVTDIGGTTRDWVSTEVLIPPLAATIIDTAGLDAALAAMGDEVDEAAQARSVETIQKADLVLFVLDLSQPMPQIDYGLLDRFADKRVLPVLNKSDLRPHLDPTTLPAGLGDCVRVSAKQATGLDDLIQAVHHTLNVSDFPLETPVAFTTRQHTLLEAIASSGSEAEVASLISELSEGSVSV